MMTAMTGFAVGKIMVVTKGDNICFPDASNELKKWQIIQANIFLIHTRANPDRAVMGTLITGQ